MDVEPEAMLRPSEALPRSYWFPCPKLLEVPAQTRPMVSRKCDSITGRNFLHCAALRTNMKMVMLSGGTLESRANDAEWTKFLEDVGSYEASKLHRIWKGEGDTRGFSDLAPSQDNT